MEQLPDAFDLIVVGTGMPECIIAAAAARIGKTVLHLDRYSYYGGSWASFNFEHFVNWIEEQKNLCTGEPPVDRMMEVTWLEQLDDSERLVLCPKFVPTITNVIQKTFIREKPPQPPVVASNSTTADPVSSVEDTHSVTAITAVDDEQSVEQPSELDQQKDASCDEQTSSSNSAEESASNPTSADEPDGNRSSSTASGSSLPEASADITEPPQKEWTMQDLQRDHRKFNIDLIPKVLFSRGSMVELLISSNIARYAEFQSVNRILTYISGHLEQVPCSRADVFSTKNVSVVEKRMLMKLLNFCAEFQKHPEEYRGFEGVPFIEFLRSRKLTSNIEHYVLHAIAMVDESCPTLQGLKATQKFMDSLGRYGNSPFLWTCYGSGELPQCFCRLCAVFGGIYYLKRDADAVILNSGNECKGIISRGQKIKCQSLVMEYSYSPLRYIPSHSPKMVSRAVYITDSSLLLSERQQNTLLRLPPVDGIPSAVTALEFGSLSFISPNNLYIVHMICQSQEEAVEQDFEFAKRLFDMDEEKGSGDDVVVIKKPKVLWCSYFRQQDTTHVDMNSMVPPGLFLTSSPGGEQDYEYAVKEARDIFEKLYPGEEFLPRAPEPEDIVMEEHSNPGNHESNENTDESGNTSDNADPTTDTKTATSEKNEPETKTDTSEKNEPETKTDTSDKTDSEVKTVTNDKIDRCVKSDTSEKIDPVNTDTIGLDITEAVQKFLDANASVKNTENIE